MHLVWCGGSATGGSVASLVGRMGEGRRDGKAWPRDSPGEGDGAIMARDRRRSGHEIAARSRVLAVRHVRASAGDKLSARPPTARSVRLAPEVTDHLAGMKGTR